MPLRIDPELNEVRALKQAVAWRRQRVLEIGCGDGRLTLRLARLGASVMAIDTDAALIRAARRALPARHRRQVRYAVGSADRLEQPDAAFDVGVFSWVL